MSPLQNTRISIHHTSPTPQLPGPTGELATQRRGRSREGLRTNPLPRRSRRPRRGHQRRPLTNPVPRPTPRHRQSPNPTRRTRNPRSNHSSQPGQPNRHRTHRPTPRPHPVRHGHLERSCRNQGTPQKLTGRSANSQGPTTPHGHGSQLSRVPRRRRWTSGLRTAPAGRPRRRPPARPGPGRGDARHRRRRAGRCRPRRAGRHRWCPGAPRRRPRPRRPR